MQDKQSLQTSPASLDLALIGNCQISALVDAKAHIVWCCMPRFDSTPVFDALMHSAEGIGSEGVFSVEIEHLARSEQRYEPGTAIVRTELWDAQGQGIEVIDFAPRFITRDRPSGPRNSCAVCGPWPGIPAFASARHRVATGAARPPPSPAAAITCATSCPNWF